MPRLDRYHHCVRRALIKDGWEITHDPFTLGRGGVRIYIDLAADYVVRGNLEDVAIEVKVFSGNVRQVEFVCACGQYDFYRTILTEAGIDRELYLALSQTAWESVQKREAFLVHLRRRNIHLLIFDVETEEVLQWIKQPN